MPNRLADESSPYLLQHANNPVQWYPWGDEALARARRDDKPIFLSIGYSACHWCHVMEHESFENQEIADFLNEHFVSIKVDREERPDIDQIYMQAVMAIHGHGGWPLSAFLTPEQQIFYGGTYWPPTARGQMPGFDQVIRGVLDAYQNRRDAVNQQSQQITQMIRAAAAAPVEQRAIDASLIELATTELLRQFDSTHGGFGGAPKFPHPMDLKLLLNVVQHGTGLLGKSPPRDQLLQMVQLTLQKMARGGIYDHLGGGFARYSVDARWLVPHFEKMLYDNAQLASVYLQTGRLTENSFYDHVAQETLDYVLRDMTDPAGGFYSTEDADSEGEEGKFYVWSRSEVLDVLGAESGPRFCELYDVTETGNFEGKSILNLPVSLEAFADQRGLDLGDLQVEMQSARQQLLRQRNQRVPPGKDDKVLVSWNALAIDALARAAVQCDDSRYLQAAVASGQFIWNQMRDDEGRLLHTWRQGTAKLKAYLDDYAYLIVAFHSLYQASFDGRWIDRAVELAETMVDRFADSHTGGFFFTADDHEKLLARTKDYQDSSVPSGNAMAALGLLRLGRLCGNSRYIELAETTIRSALPLISRAPMAAGQMLVVVEELLRGSTEYVLIAGDDALQNRQALMALRRELSVDDCLIMVDADRQNVSSHVAPLLQDKATRAGEVTLFVCRNYACEQPVAGVPAIRAAVRPQPV